MPGADFTNPGDASPESAFAAERRAFPGRPYDLLPVGHLAALPEGRLLRINPSLAAMLGYGSLNELNRSCRGLAHGLWEEPSDWQALVCLVETRGEVERYPASLRRRDGVILPCAVWARRAAWSWAGIAAVEVVVQSEIERHQVFSALTQVLRLHRDMMDLNPDPVLIHEQNRILMANPAAETFFHSPERGSLVGRGVDDLLDSRCTEDVHRHIRAAAAGRPSEEEFLLVLANGEERWVRDFSTTITYHRQPAILTLLHNRTDRRRAERLYRTIAESAPDPIFIHSEGLLLYANPATAAFLGESDPAALVGRSLFDLFRPDMVPVLQARIRDILASQGVSEAEYTLHRPDDVEKHVLARSTCVDYQGRPAILSALHDQTGRRQAEQHLADARRFYRVLADNLPEAVCLHEDGRILYANPCQRQLLAPGEASDLCGRRLEEFLHPDTLPTYERRMAAIRAGRGEVLEEYPVRYADGRLVHVAEKTVPVLVEGRQALLAIVRDVTDRVAAEQALAEAERLHRTVLENMPEAVCLHDDGRILYANPCLHRLFSPEDASSLVGRHMTEFLHPDFLPVFHRRRAEVLSGQGESSGEYPIRFTDGRLRHVADNTLLLTIQGRGVFLAIIRDVTERVEAQQARDEAEELYRTIVETSPDPIMIYELGRILFANPAMARFCRVGNVVELLNMAADDVVDKETASRLRARIRAVAEGTADSENISSIRLRSGEVLHYHAYTVPLRYQGRDCLLTALHDLTGYRATQQARDEAEELYRTIVETSPDPIFIYNQEGLLYANKALARFYQVGSVAELMRMGLDDLVDEESAARLKARITSLYEGTADAASVSTIRLRSGEVRHSHVSTVFITYQGRRCLLTALHDLTPYRQAQSERDQALARYEDLFQFAPLGIGTGLSSGRLERANSHLAAMFGYASPAAMVAEVKDIPSDMFADPEDCIRLRQLTEQQGMLLDFECLAKRRDGSVFWTSRCVRVVRGTGGEVRGYEGFIRDISAHRQAESERNQALARYEDLFQSAPLGIAEGKPERHFVRVNPCMAEIFGYCSPAAMVAEVTDIAAQIFADPEDYWRLRRLVEGLDEVKDFACLGLRRDGTRLWASHSLRVVRGPDGGLTGFEAYVRDITFQRQAQSERDQALARYEDLFQSAPLGIVVFIPARGEIRVNRRMAEMFGYPSPEAMVEEVGDDPTRIYADPADNARLLRLAKSLGEVQEFECLSRRRDGTLFWASRCVRLVCGPEGGMQGYEAFVRDITLQRQAESERNQALARNEDLFQSAPLGIAVYVPGRGYVRVNRRMAEIFGYPSPEVLVEEVGDDPSRLYADPADHARLRRLVRARAEVRDFECLSRRRDGTLFWASRSIRSVHGPDGAEQGYEAFIRDITERREAKEEAAERGRRVQVLAGELAMASERERRSVARDLHDGPVQHLALATLLIDELARREGREQEFAPALDLLRETAGQLRATLDDLTPPAFFADSLAGALASLARDFGSRHGLAVEVFCPELPDLSREAVAFLCRTVRELLVNAVKHGRSGRATVQVDVRGRSLWLIVADNGHGFDPGLLERAGLFSQGLPGLRSLARDLGGGMVVDSSPGLGTRVVLDLPLDPLCATQPLLG